MATKIPSIPSVPAGISPQLAQFLSSVKEMMEIREGRRGLDADQFVTRGDLNNTNLLVDLGLDYKSLVSSSTDPIDPPTNFSVVKGHWCNYLSWTNPTDEMFAGIEVWVNTSNDRSGATLTAVITKPADTYVHYMSDFTNPHYYWIRARSYNPDVYSTWLPTAMMGGEVVPGDDTVGETIEKILSVLEDQVTESQLYEDLNTRLDKIETTESAAAQNTSDIGDGIGGTWASISSKVQITDYENDLNLYDAETVYYANDQVQYNGHLYECMDDDDGEGISNVLPTDTDHWAENDGMLERTALAEEKLWVGTGGEGTEESPASDSLLAQWAVKLNVNNHIAGVGLSLDEEGFSSFMILADKFAIINPENEEQAEKIPFIVGEVDGESQVGIDGNLVVDGTILARHVAADQIDGDHISATSVIALASGGSLTMGSGVTLEIAEGGVLNIIGSLAITGGAEGIAQFSDAGGLAVKDDVAEGDLQSGVTDRMFLDPTTKTNIEAWRRAGSPTYMDGAYIYAQTITADKFISTLYGDLNQAMNFVKAILSAGDEYEHAIIASDLSGATKTDIDGAHHIDYGLSIRIAMTRLWDDGSAWWDTGGCFWDQPTEASGIFQTASIDLGSSKSLQIALGYQLVEDLDTATSYTVEAIYSTDDSNWGTNGTALDDGNWETLNTRNISGNTYRSNGNLFTYRYFKIKVTLTTTDTSKRIILYNMYFKGNVVNVYGFFENQTIAAGGTNFSITGFNSTPAITVTTKGATPLVPLITAASSSSFTVKLYNLSGSAVGGVADIIYMGV